MSEEEEVQLGAGMIEFGEPWSVRIPAAIKNAERNTQNGWLLLEGMKEPLTAGEVAAIKALWEAKEGFITMGGDPPPELIAFTEKIEKLA